jgi:hypothetical protein
MGSDELSARRPAGILDRRTLLATGGVLAAGCLDSGGNGTDSDDGTEVDDDGPDTGSGTTSTTSTGAPDDTTRVDGDTFVVEGGGTQAVASGLRFLEEEAGRTLRFTPGTYEIEPTQKTAERFGDYQWVNTHLTLFDAEDATIEGDGATLVMTDPTRGAFRCLGSSIAMSGLEFDYDPLPFTQGTIQALSDDGNTIVLEIDDGYVGFDHFLFDTGREVNGTLHEPDGSYVTETIGDGSNTFHFASMDRQEEGTYRLALSAQSATAGLEAGRKLAVTTRPPGTHGLAFNDCRPTIEDLTIRASPSWALFAFLCRDPVVRNVTMAPPADSDRLLSVSADGIHVNNNRDGPVVENCHVEQLGDDSLVVDTTAMPVESVVDDRTVEVGFGLTMHVQAGDVLAAASNAGVRKGELPPLADVTISSDGDRPPYQYESVTFEEPIADTLAEGDVLVNTATANTDFEVRNNTLLNTRARPIRIAASDGVIENNVVDGSGAGGILMRQRTNVRIKKSWIENLTVRNNEVRRSGLVGLSWVNPGAIKLVTHTGPETEGRPHRNLEIVDNRIANGGSFGMDLHDADGLTIEGNEMDGLNRLGFGGRGYGLKLFHDRDTDIQNNTVSGEGDTLTGFAVVRDNESTTTAGNTLTVDGEAQPVELVPWEDR